MLCTRIRSHELTAVPLQMDIVEWNQHPNDVHADLPFTRRHGANLSDAQFDRATESARQCDGGTESLGSGTCR